MEKLQIGEVIQSLRRKNKITQEQLANYVGVSTAAVSKWESKSSYPDIVILPKLASFFKVSIDELMNYKINLSKEDVSDILKECESLIEEGKLEESISLSKEYIKKYPLSYLLKYKLIQVYTMYTILINDDKKILNANIRSIEILKDIAKNCNDINLKESSLFQLSSKFISLNNLDKAEECLKKIHVPEVDPNTILPSIYFEQGKVEDGRRLLQNNLLRSLIQMYSSCAILASTYCDYREESDGKNLDTEKAKKYIDLSIKIKSAIETGTKSIIPVDSTYLMLAKIYTRNKEKDKAIDCLGKMIVDINKFNKNGIVNTNELWCFDYLQEEEQICSEDILKKTYENLAKMIELDLSDLKDNERYSEILEEIKELSKV